MKGQSCEGCDLRNANFEGVKFRSGYGQISLARADLSGANLRNAYGLDINFKQATLRGADLSGAQLNYAELRFANLQHANLAGAIFSLSKCAGTDFEGADLTGTSFQTIFGNPIDCPPTFDTKLRY